MRIRAIVVLLLAADGIARRAWIQSRAGETVLRAGDEVLAVVASRQQAALEAILGRPNGSNQIKTHAVSKQP